MSSPLHTVVTTFLNAFVGLCVFISGAALTSVNYSLQQTGDLTAEVLFRHLIGPTGLLVGSLFTVWFLVRYLGKLNEKVEKNIVDRFAEKDQIIAEKQAQIKVLEDHIRELQAKK